MSKKYILFVLAAALLQAPLSASAEEAQTIELDPPADMTSAMTVGKLTICCDGTMNGSIFEVQLHQEEGDLLYYSFKADYDAPVRVVCPLKKDGDYRLFVKVPQDTSAELLTYCYLFSIQDPDPVDHPADFDSTEMTLHFAVDPALSADSADEHEAVLKNRIYQAESFYTYARKAFLPGDTNSDGIVNAKDANRILLAAAALGVNSPTGLSSLETAVSDLNGDGVLNAKDANITLAYAAAIGVNAFSGSAAEFAKSRYLQ